jgi:hypothetical protein
MRCFFLLFFVNTLAAQTNTTEKLKLPSDRVIEINGQKIRLSKVNGTDHKISIQRVPDSTRVSSMPNALNGFNDYQKKVGNNKQGFDIHLSQIDNMPVLKPDAQNVSSLTNSLIQLQPKMGTGEMIIIQEAPLQPFKYYQPLAPKEKKLLELFKSK